MDSETLRNWVDIARSKRRDGRIKIKQVILGDWEVFCHNHGLTVTCSHWDDAMEIALGHSCMKHPTTRT